ncbi:hypothetical protein DSL72_006553 [Monilinia vaccinii-corymbosi]|uniref:BZIP domain-containing protein n=1 Tax=Monilinia vaccinii-corymbosi TaxID=61207 RepID=A0A8A3PMI5_9HELO|nr:hypothetical protein DSL72_006553 [Monilinia vaccinii-corymbosi]
MSQPMYFSKEPVGSDGGGLCHSGSTNTTGKKVDEKKRVSRAGTRSVSTLSPAQLARKRANDREAQRNIRLRTKEHIERLEARIEELTKGRNPDLELEEVRRRNEALEREVRVLNESIAQLRADDSPTSARVYGFAAGILQLQNGAKESKTSKLTSRRLGESCAAQVVRHMCPLDVYGPDRSTGLPFRHSTNMPSSLVQDICRGISTSGPINPQTLETPWYQHPATSRNPTGTNRHLLSMPFGPINGVPQVIGSSSTGALDETSRMSYFDPIPQVNFNDGNWAPRSLPPGAVQSANAATIPGHTQPHFQSPLQHTFSASIASSRPVIPPPLHPYETNHGVSFSSPLPLQPWDLPILNISTPTCGVDSILMSIVNTQKRIGQQGAPVDHIIGPPQPSMKALILPDDPNQTHNISTMISRLLMSLAVRGLPERAGCLYLMYHICQWQIYPSSSTYENLTDWSSPRTSQLITPHPIWADSILWGKLKDKVIENPDLYANEEFQDAYILGISVNWTRPEAETFRWEGNDIFITEEFENHIKTLSNWSLDERFAARYPELAPLVKISGAGSGGEPCLQVPYAL